LNGLNEHRFFGGKFIIFLHYMVFYLRAVANQVGVGVVFKQLVTQSTNYDKEKTVWNLPVTS
jgi:hypothetical protein